MDDEKATCRGCHRVLDGNPYWKGGAAYVPGTRKRAVAHYFGGWVCCAACDVRVFKEMKAANVWGSTEARLMASAFERHNEL